MLDALKVSTCVYTAFISFYRFFVFRIFEPLPLKFRTADWLNLFSVSKLTNQDLEFETGPLSLKKKYYFGLQCFFPVLFVSRRYDVALLRQLKSLVETLNFKAFSGQIWMLSRFRNCH